MKLPDFLKDRLSTSFAMMASTFAILSLWLVAWIFVNPVISIWLPATIPAFDATTASLWFAPLAALYFARRREKAKQGSPDKPTETDMTNDS